jgi:uncharacterized membrane protein
MATLAMRQPLLHRVSWGALFAGFFFGFGMWMLLLALGAGIGFAAFDPRDLQQWQGLGVGFGIWGVISGIISMFLAGWLAARLSAADSKLAGMLHGAALWGFMLVAGLWIATMAVTRTAATAASAAGTAAQAAGSAASDPNARRQMQQGAQSAQQQVQGLAQKAQANKDEAADAAKKAGTTGAWAFFLYGILTLAAALFGGRAGVPHDRHLVAREETAPLPNQPLSPQRV